MNGSLSGRAAVGGGRSSPAVDRLFHDLRRTGVRNMERAGVPRQRAMLISDLKTESTYERYNITSREDLEQAAVQVQRYLDTLPVER